VGRLAYPGPLYGVEIDDRTLAHVRVVIMTKLRRSEPFMFPVSSPHGTGTISYWLSAHIPIQFEFRAPHRGPLNRACLDALARSANSIDGMYVVPEPDAALVSDPSADPR
jgi:hypothetical protein